jgi:BMFP domain-containing protein YqiC
MISILAKTILHNTLEHLPKLSANNAEHMHTLHVALQEQLELALKKANLVSRTEFDIQADVLQRTQAQIVTLEEQVSALEKTIKEIMTKK